MNDYAITTVTPFLIASACTIGTVIFYALGCESSRTGSTSVRAAT